MLIRFSVENVLSFRARTDLTFVATARKEAPGYSLPTRHAKHGLLPVVGLWGANASGKSNLLTALSALRSSVEHSFTKLQPDQPVPWHPWMMRKGKDSPPSYFELEFVNGEEVRFQFGYRQDASGFCEEWLYRWAQNRPQLLYHRDHARADPWYFGPNLKGSRKEIAQATRPNCLFLSAAAQFNHADLLPVFEAITQGVASSGPVFLGTAPIFLEDAPLLSAGLRPTLIELLRFADTGIVEADVQQLRAEEYETVLDFRPDVEPAAKGRVVVHFVHGTDSMDGWTAPPTMESAGTHRLLSRISEILSALRSGSLLIADEFHAGLQPELAGALIDLFLSPETNPHGAQLLFTAHDRAALSRLRSDEVGLIDKDRHGQSVLRYASDYKGVRSRDNLRVAHEQGRIRGVPVLGDLKSAMAKAVRA